MSKVQKANTDAFYEKGLTDKFPFTTLLKNEIQKSWNNTWYPIPTAEYRKILKINTKDNIMEILLNNLSYNLQYIEFIEKELKELQPSSVLIKMLQKTYVITAGSIIEGILINIIISHGWSKKEPKKISFADAIKIIEKKCEENNFDTDIIDKIDRIRNLRNKVHLTHKSPEDKTSQKENNILDHDYNAFDKNIKAETGAVLYTILTSSEVSNNPEYFDFLKVNCTNAQN